MKDSCTLLTQARKKFLQMGTTTKPENRQYSGGKIRRKLRRKPCTSEREICKRVNKIFKLDLIKG